ncbi:MAG: hypothetical protein NWE78_00810 [Candidatus Bathyarchaeota archaeon]|jgi:hypothetical protein|nr:hypothetical protein [Candidatus Bathyarchaeota archaeon]
MGKGVKILKLKTLTILGLVIFVALVTASFAVYGNGVNNDEDLWEEMREHMEDHMGEFEDQEWWDEMREHMEDHWDNLEEDENYSYGRHGCH